jgi:hypothetical protein
MNQLIHVTADTLPNLIDRATQALANARTAAEVLEARDMARMAYDAAKSFSRMEQAKRAHDTLMAEVYRAQANALAIEARAKMRLAEEYDAAQDRGEVASGSVRTDIVADHNDVRPATAADLGIRRDEIHEARQFRDAERADPGIIDRTISRMIERGEEPTKAALRREVIAKPAPRVSQRGLWVWGRIKDFERDGYLAAGADALLAEMTPEMRLEVRRYAPEVAAFIQQIGRGAAE